MTKLLIDFETTGVIQYKKPLTDLLQPRGVQLSLIAYDDNNHIKTELNVLVKPDGWTIPKEATDVHGITMEECQKYGIPFRDIWVAAKPIFNAADVIIAHNLDFDSKIFFIEFYREFLCDKEDPEKKADANYKYILKKGFCTMNASTNVLKIPGKYKDYKWPNLQEAHKYFTGKEFEGAHDASADTKAAFEVYKGLEKLGLT